MSDLFLFALFWCTWCLLHSLLISWPLADLLERCCGRATRIFYNLIALATLLPLIFWGEQHQEASVLQWPGTLWPLRAVMLLLALWLIIGGGRAYNLGHFLGVAELRRAKSSGVKVAEDSLLRGGMLERVRHPWYSAGLLILWCRDLDRYTFTSSVILSAYLIIGAFLEEQRLLKRFGKAYRDYCRDVPMFIPRFFLPRP